MTWQIKAAAILLALAGVLGGILWVQGIRHDLETQAKLAADAAASVKALKDTASKTHQMQKDKDVALAKANLRAQANARAAAAANAIADSMRNDLNTANQRLASAPDQAVREYATALSVVFGDCEAAYRGMASNADGHATDAAKFSDSWPVDPGQRGK